MAAVTATLEAIESDGMIENALAVEERLRTAAASIPGVVSVRGKGCLLGIQFDGPCAGVHSRLLENNIITGTSSDPKVLRLLPPLCVSAAQIDQFTEVLAQ